MRGRKGQSQGSVRGRMQVGRRGGRVGVDRRRNDDSEDSGIFSFPCFNRLVMLSL